MQMCLRNEDTFPSEMSETRNPGGRSKFRAMCLKEMSYSYPPEDLASEFQVQWEVEDVVPFKVL